LHYVVYCLDKTDALPIRLANLAAHRAYLGTAKVKILIAGPLLADDGATPVGSLFLVEADSKEDVLAFNSADPLAQAGLWAQVHIDSFDKRIDRR